jgi:hypothetical protein
MNQEFCIYTQALALRELGFDEPCYSIHDYGYMIPRITTMAKPRFINSKMNVGHVSKTCSAPTYSQAFRWLRNQYATCWYIKSEYPAFYGLFIHNGTDYDHTVYDTYEEAESACLDKLIEICKNTLNKQNNEQDTTK